MYTQRYILISISGVSGFCALCVLALHTSAWGFLLLFAPVPGHGQWVRGCVGETVSG